METQVIIRTIVLFIVLLNQVLLIAGLNPLPFSEEDIYNGVSVFLTIVASVWSWWKNNSFTRAAREADAYMRSRKEQLKRGEE